MMRQKLFANLLVAIAVLLTASFAMSVCAQESSREEGDLAVSEEIRRTFQLSSDDRVNVSTIAGPVEVETTDGGTAEVHIVRSAQTRRELDCYRTIVEQTPGGLSIRHEQFSRREGCNNIRSRQRVQLVVPRTIELHIDTIAGDVNIGRIDGALHLDAIAGEVRVAGARTAEISGLAKGLTMTLARIEGRGVRVSGIVGDTVFRVTDELNADLTVSGIIGEISTDASGVRLNRIDVSNYRVRIGAGGAPISVSGVVGNVSVRRA